MSELGFPNQGALLNNPILLNWNKKLTTKCGAPNRICDTTVTTSNLQNYPAVTSKKFNIRGLEDKVQH